MGLSLDRIEAEAMMLPREQRARFIAFLLASLDDDDEGVTDPPADVSPTRTGPEQADRS